MARSSKLAAVAAAPAATEPEAADVKSGLDLGELNTHIGYFARRFQVWIFQDLIQELASAQIRIVYQPFDRIGESFRVSWRHKEAIDAVADQLDNPGGLLRLRPRPWRGQRLRRDCV